MVSQKSTQYQEDRPHMKGIGRSKPSEDTTKKNTDVFVDNNAQSRVVGAQRVAANRAIHYLQSQSIRLELKMVGDGTYLFKEDKQLVAREIPNMDALGL